MKLFRGALSISSNVSTNIVVAWRVDLSLFVDLPFDVISTIKRYFVKWFKRFLIFKIYLRGAFLCDFKYFVFVKNLLAGSLFDMPGPGPRVYPGPGCPWGARSSSLGQGTRSVARETRVYPGIGCSRARAFWVRWACQPANGSGVAHGGLLLFLLSVKQPFYIWVFGLATTWR